MKTMLNCTFCKESFASDAKWYEHIMKHLLQSGTTIRSTFEALVSNEIYTLKEA